MNKLSLPRVTLCAVTSVNVDATIAALRASLDQADFADCILFTDAHVPLHHFGIRVVGIERLQSARDYSDFVLKEIGAYICSSHCLIVQWDGFVTDANLWDPGFLTYDYIGAPWPQFADCHDVGNGGFSLRSRKLLEACSDPAFSPSHPEDVSICRDNRPLLEAQFGILFADKKTAERFAHERGPHAARSFGFHGVFNMIPIVGAERFWQLYTSLDDPRTAFVDYWILIDQLRRGDRAFERKLRLTADWLRHSFARRSGGLRSRFRLSKRTLRSDPTNPE